MLTQGSYSNENNLGGQNNFSKISITKLSKLFTRQKRNSPYSHLLSTHPAGNMDELRIKSYFFSWKHEVKDFLMSLI